MARKPDLTDAEIFTIMGRALSVPEDWPSRFGEALGLSKQVVRDIRRDRVDLTARTAAEMLAMLDQMDVVRARDALKARLKKLRS
jgi:hypothetical protein